VSGAGTGRPDPEVPGRARRRRLTAQYKLEILAAYDAAPMANRVHCYAGRACIPAISWNGAGPATRVRWRGWPGHGADPGGTREERIARLERKKRQLEQELAKARFVVEVQAKLHVLLETISRSKQPGGGSRS
jgi:transposase